MYLIVIALVYAMILLSLQAWDVYRMAPIDLRAWVSAAIPAVGALLCALGLILAIVGAY